MVQMNKVPVQSEGFVARKLGDEMIFVSESGNELHTLNDIGTFIWNTIDGTKSLGEILDIICIEYDVERKTALADLDLFIRELEWKKLISLKEKYHDPSRLCV